jgi:hypothetical protein
LEEVEWLFRVDKATSRRGWVDDRRGARRTSGVVKGYSMPAVGHRNVTVPRRVPAGVE